MAKYKAYNYRQNVLLAVDFEKQLVPGTLEYTIHVLVEERMDTAILDQNYKNDDTGCTAYDPKVLKLRARAAKVRGNIERRYEASKKGCHLCPLRSQCLLTKKTKRKNLCIRQCGEPVNLSKKMREKIDTEEGRRIYGKRLGIVVPVFANIRHNKRLDRFTLRGNIKVNIQWALYCMVHNMEKITHFGYA